MVLTRNDPNRALLERAVELLRPVLDELVFVGGCATGLLITDPASSGIRPTKDVDAIVEVGSYAQYDALAARLRALHFQEDSQDGVICRWRHPDVILDVMPTDARVLGFSNRWFGASIAQSREVHLESGRIRAIGPVYFLATKLEAFHGRAGQDFTTSHDLEDVMAVVDGRPEIADEVLLAETDVRAYLSVEFGRLLEEPRFIDALDGFLLPDAASQQRSTFLVHRLRLLATASGVRLVLDDLDQQLDRRARQLLNQAAATGTLLTGGTVRGLSDILVSAFGTAADSLIGVYREGGERGVELVTAAVRAHLSPMVEQFVVRHASPLRTFSPVRHVAEQGRGFLATVPDRVAVVFSRTRL